MQLQRHHLAYAGLATVAGVSALVLFAGYALWCPVRSRAAHVRLGMTEAQVEQLLGPCDDDVSIPPAVKTRIGSLKTWHGKHTWCQIWFGPDGEVRHVALHDLRNRPEFVDRFLIEAQNIARGGAP